MILQLATRNVRGLRDGAWRFAPERGGPGHVTVVTGPQGAGLTTFLDAITYSAAQMTTGSVTPGPGDVIHAGASVANIRTTFRLEPDEQAFGGLADETASGEVIFQRGGVGRASADPALLALLTRYDHSAGTSKVLPIPARRFGDGAGAPLGNFESEMRASRYSLSPGKFTGLLFALSLDAAGRGDGARFAAVQSLFGELCATARLVWGELTREVEFELGSGMRVPLGRLGFSERNAFVLAAAPVLLGLDRSIILLDTPELGLAPGEAARWLGVLRNRFSRAQWIVATRDPAVLASVEPGARIEIERGVS